MTTTYELYTNENGTPKAVEGKAPAIIERVEALEETLDNGVVTSVNDETGTVQVKKLIMGEHVLELQEDGSLKLDDALVLTNKGGLIDGSFKFVSDIGYIECSETDGYFEVTGAPWNQGARITLFGKDHTESGSFNITATDGERVSVLQAHPDGRLFWKGVSFRQFGMPNYSAGVEYPWAVGNVAPSDGWLKIRGGIVSDKMNAMVLYIDGVLVANSLVEWNVTLYTTFLVPVCKGSSFYAEGTNSEASLVFYPCVGI